MWLSYLFSRTFCGQSDATAKTKAKCVAINHICSGDCLPTGSHAALRVGFETNPLYFSALPLVG